MDSQDIDTPNTTPSLKGEMWRIFNQKIKNNRSTLVIIVSFVSVSLLWFIKQVENGYIVPVDIVSNYTNLPQGYRSSDLSTQKFTVNVKMNGFNILSYTLSNQRLEVDMPKVVEKKGGRHFWIPSKHPKLVAKAVATTDIITKISKDTIYLNIGDEVVKTVPVIHKNINLDFRNGFCCFGDIAVSPSAVRIYGTPEELAKISEIELGAASYQDLHSPIRDSMKLSLPKEFSKVRIQPSKVVINANVVPYTEGQYVVPIKSLNVPNGYSVKFIPDKVSVSYRVSIENYNRVSEKDFRVLVDFKNVGNNNTYVYPTVSSSPDFVSHVRLRPDRVDFLFVK